METEILLLNYAPVDRLPGHTRFLVHRTLLAPFTKLLHLQLPFNQFLVLRSVVVGPFTDRTL